MKTTKTTTISVWSRPQTKYSQKYNLVLATYPEALASKPQMRRFYVSNGHGQYLTTKGSKLRLI